MYKDELKKQLKILAYKKQISMSVSEVIYFSREILRLTCELEKIETEKKRIWTSLRKA